MFRCCLLGLMCLSLMSCATGWGTGQPDHDHIIEYKQVYQATYDVLAGHFNVRTSKHTPRDGDIIAVSQVHSDGGQLYRWKINARVVRDEDDLFQPMVRVCQQIDVSQAHVHRRSNAQPQYQWRTVAFNEHMEAQLRNEIDAALHGRANADGRWMRWNRGSGGGPASDPNNY